MLSAVCYRRYTFLYKYCLYWRSADLKEHDNQAKNECVKSWKKSFRMVPFVLCSNTRSVTVEFGI